MGGEKQGSAIEDAMPSRLDVTYTGDYVMIVGPGAHAAREAALLSATDAENSDRSINYVVNQLLVEKYQPQ